jgi:hypothetical protein
MLAKHNLFILACNFCYAINFLYSINFDSLNYNFKCYFIRIIFINLNNLNSKDNYLSNSIIIKANLKIRLRLLRIIINNYLKILIDLYY